MEGVRRWFGKVNSENMTQVCRVREGLTMTKDMSESSQSLFALFSERKIEKTYHAVAPSSDLDFPIIRKTRIVKGEPFFRMQEAPGEPNSETLIECIERRGSVSLYRLKPVTGRKHQLRVHLSSLHIPIMNDPFYPKLDSKYLGDKTESFEEVFSNPLQLLAKKLSFVDPLTKQTREFVSQRAL